MSIILNINGTSYQFPENGDENWGEDVTDWAQAVTLGMLQKAGGEFLLQSEVDFGGAFGLKSVYYKSTTEDVASVGQLRLARTDSIAFRNEQNDNNLLLSVNSSNQLTFNGAVLGTASEITNDDVAANAAIALSKLASVAATSLVGRAANSSGAMAAITASTNGFVLRRASNELSFGLLLNENIDAAAAISVSKLDGSGTDGNVLTIESNVAVWKALPTIADGSITAAKLASNSVTNEKINNLAVTSAKIADEAVTTAKIADEAVDNTKLRPFQGNVAGSLLVDIIQDQIKRPAGGTNMISVNAQGRPFVIGMTMGGALSTSGTDRIATTGGVACTAFVTEAVPPAPLDRIVAWRLNADSNYIYPFTFEKMVMLPDGQHDLYLYFDAPVGAQIAVQNVLFYVYEL